MSSTPDLRVLTDPVLTPELVDRLVAIWVDVTNANGAVGFVPPVGAGDVGPVARDAFGRTSEGPDHLLIAYEGEEPIGFCFLEQRPGPLFRHWAFIKRLQVHPSLQGRGYGGAFLEAVHEAARRMGLEALHLTVRGGTGTDLFYARHGYEEMSRIPGVIRVAPGDDREEIYMIKTL